MISPPKLLIAILTIICTLLLTTCHPPPIQTEIPLQKEALQIRDFPNVLNYIGRPKNLKDPSVYAFSDLGAWHGYALPDSANRSLLGSFMGPLLMTQDNGIWISPCLSRLHIMDMKTGLPIDFANAEVEEVVAFPGRLIQRFKTAEPPLSISSTLIFVSDRSAMMRIQVTNLYEDEVAIKMRWSGNSFFPAKVFSEQADGVQIDFEKNNHIGMISTGEPQHTTYHVEGETYEIFLPPKRIGSKATLESLLIHSFCFSREEWEKEKKVLAQILPSQAAVFGQNTERWNSLLQSTLTHESSALVAPINRRAAVKCLLTLTHNWRSPAGFLKHEGLFPSYNYEWFQGFWAWDSWKHAVAVAHFNGELAQNQIRAMFDFQDEMGMIADCVYRDTVIEAHNWRNTKPPLSAWATWRVYEKTQDKKFLREMLPKIERYHQWWYTYRDHDQNGLCEYGSTDGTLIAAKWESGMDNAVRFDSTKILQNNESSWSMNCESVDLNAYLCAEKQYLSQIAIALGETDIATFYKRKATYLKEQIQTRFFDKKSGWFYDIDMDSKKPIKTMGPEGWIPLWTGIATQSQAAKVRENMLDTALFATYIPFPTLNAAHPKFKPQNGYWRGPIWLDQVYFAINALKNYGYEDEADQMTQLLFKRLEGFQNSDTPIYENYHPLTGEGMESRHFSWSAAHLLLLMKEG